MTLSAGVIFVTFFALIGAQDDIGCYVEGKCIMSNFNNQDESETPELCHQLCIDTPDCLYWTHIVDGDNFFCFSFTNCPEFVTDCGDLTCTSGELQCPVQGHCNFMGRCEGGEVQLYFDIGSIEDCAQLCSCNDDCQFYTYDSSVSTCNLLTDCEFIDGSCDTCTSGEDGCDSSTTCDLTTVHPPTHELPGYSECPSEFVPTNPETTTVGPSGCNLEYLTVDGECYIATPGFPGPYAKSACKDWSFRSTLANGIIYIHFSRFDLACGTDTVAVYDGRSNSDPLMAVFDGCNPPIFDYTATSGFMFVEFRSHSSANHHGFLADVYSFK